MDGYDGVEKGAGILHDLQVRLNFTDVFKVRGDDVNVHEIIRFSRNVVVVVVVDILSRRRLGLIYYI